MQDNTREKIIAVASNLFFTKGYEKTTIADIIKGLDGLTKGAIYHHFESKEDIFNAVVDTIGNKNIEIFNNIKNDPNLKGAEKLTKIVSTSFYNENMDKITEISPNLLDSPKLLSSFMKEINEITIPQYIEPIIKEGIYDGSIHATHEKELAELIAIMLNIWMNPLMFQRENTSIIHKMEMMNEIFESYHIILFHNELIEKLTSM